MRLFLESGLCSKKYYKVLSCLIINFDTGSASGPNGVGDVTCLDLF